MQNKQSSFKGSGNIFYHEVLAFIFLLHGLCEQDDSQLCKIDCLNGSNLLFYSFYLGPLTDAKAQRSSDHILKTEVVDF